VTELNFKGGTPIEDGGTYPLHFLHWGVKGVHKFTTIYAMCVHVIQFFLNTAMFSI